MKAISATRNSTHIPLRTCVGCRTVMAKGKLIRLVPTMPNRVQIDRTGRQPGRGAYLCACRDCWEKGLKGNRLEHTLRAKMDEESRKLLWEYGQALPRRL